MNAIIRTWPSFMPRSKVLDVFNHNWGTFYFTLGRGRPSKPIELLYWTHKGEVLGYFHIAYITQNLGDNLPKLRSISGETSEWQIKLMNWVAVCRPPFIPAPERSYYSSFRGYRYFDFEKHLSDPYAKVRL
jgi:hypothetical protein